MKIRWVKLRMTGEIEKSVTERDVPSVGDGVYVDEIGYEVKCIVNTPHLDCPVHIFVAES